MTALSLRTASRFSLAWAVYFFFSSAFSALNIYLSLVLPEKRRNDWMADHAIYLTAFGLSSFVMAVAGRLEFVALRQRARYSIWWLPNAFRYTTRAALWLVVSISALVFLEVFILSFNVLRVRADSFLDKAFPVVDFIGYFAFRVGFATWHLNLAQIYDEVGSRLIGDTPTPTAVWRRLSKLSLGTRNWLIILVNSVLMQVLWIYAWVQPDRFVFFGPLALALSLFIVYALFHEFFSLRQLAARSEALA